VSAWPQLHIANRWDETGSNLPQRVEKFSREKGYAGRFERSESLPGQLAMGLGILLAFSRTALFVLAGVIYRFQEKRLQFLEPSDIVTRANHDYQVAAFWKRFLIPSENFPKESAGTISFYCVSYPTGSDDTYATYPFPFRDRRCLKLQEKMRATKNPSSFPDFKKIALSAKSL
jgi:hypothetical protein